MIAKDFAIAHMILMEYKSQMHFSAYGLQSPTIAFASSPELFSARTTCMIVC